jgi:hypothetical protein
MVGHSGGPRKRSAFRLFSLISLKVVDKFEATSENKLSARDQGYSTKRLTWEKNEECGALGHSGKLSLFADSA